jgi:hypothetical protein
MLNHLARIAGLKRLRAWSVISLAAAAVLFLSPGMAWSARATLSPGVRVAVRIDENVSTRYHYFGPILQETLDQDILGPNARVILPAGSTIKLAVARFKRAGRVSGRAQLRLRLYSVVLADGSEVPLDGYADALEGGHRAGREGTFHGGRSLGKDAAFDLAAIGTGAGVGLAVGGPWGLPAGAAAGLLAASVETVARRGPDLVVPAGSVVEFTLGRPVSIPLADQVVEQPSAYSSSSYNPPAYTPASTSSNTLGGEWGRGLAIPPSSDLLNLTDSLNDPHFVLERVERLSFKDRPESDRIFVDYLRGVCHLKMSEPKRAQEELSRAFAGAKRLNLPATAQTEIAWNLVLALKATSRDWERSPLMQDPVVQAALVQTAGGER